MVHTYFITTVVICLSIWQIHGQESALNATKTTSPTSIKPITKYPYQTLGLNSSAVTSGPILLIDKKTIFISNLHYDGSDSGASFWAGRGAPSSNGILVPDENNLTGPLKVYQGQNIYLQLPDNVTSDNIDYLGVWSKEKKVDIGHVLLYSDASEDVRGTIPEVTGFHRRTEDNKTIFRVPKCCGFNEIYSGIPGDNRCHPEVSEAKLGYTVYESNETHIDPEKFMTDIEFIPYVYQLKCPAGDDYVKLALDEHSTFGLLFNSSLIFGEPNHSGILSHGQYCMENVRNKQEPKFVMCVYIPPTTDVAGAMPNLYFPFLVISTLCFFLSALCYLFILKAKDVHQKCFIGYASSMTVTFLSLIFLQKLNSCCGFIGSLFIFSTLCSFVWLTCLCTDLIFIVKSYERYSDETRIYAYIGSSLFIPTIFLMASLIPDGWPDVPKSFVKMYSDDMCEFEDAKIAILFTPVGLLILTSLIALVYTSYMINTHNDTNDYDWVRNKGQYKFMLVQCIMIFIISSFAYVVDLIINLIDLSENPDGFLFSLVIIECMQGIFVFLILSGHNWGRKLIEKRKSKRKLIPPNPSDNHEMRPLHGREWL